MRWPHVVRTVWNQAWLCWKFHVLTPCTFPTSGEPKTPHSWKRHPGFKQKSKNKDVMLILLSFGDNQDRQSRYFLFVQVNIALLNNTAKNICCLRPWAETVWYAVSPKCPDKGMCTPAETWPEQETPEQRTRPWGQEEESSSTSIAVLLKAFTVSFLALAWKLLPSRSLDLSPEHTQASCSCWAYVSSGKNHIHPHISSTSQHPQGESHTYLLNNRMDTDRVTHKVHVMYRPGLCDNQWHKV